MCGRDGRIRLHIFLMDFCWFFCNNNVAYQMFFQVLFGRFDMESEKGKAVNVTPTKPTLCEDGKYRWMYEINMYTNPVIFLSVVKVLLISAAVVICLFLVSAIVSGNSISPPDFESGKYGLLALGVFIGVVILSYFIVAKSYGGKYIVLFEMDNNCVVHRQMDEQFKKAQAVNWLLAVVGAATGNLSAAGLGISNSVRNSVVSEWGDVKRVVPVRSMHVIMVNNVFQRNQVYASSEDFDFVLDFIRDHVLAAKANRTDNLA